MHIRGLLRRYRERPLGQSLTEFALILPVFLVILSAAIDLGRLAYARVTIANVAREASFQAAQTPTSYQAGQPCLSGFEDANLVICRAILESTGSVITVAPADISLTCSPSCDGEMGNTVTVIATGRFNLLTPVMAAFFGGSTITFSSTSTNQLSALPPPPAWPPTAPPPVVMTVVPATTGQTEAAWLSQLAAANLVAGSRSEQYHATVPSGTMISSNPPGLTPISEGSSVSYIVSKGPAPDCTIVSAGFTYTKTPANSRSPVTVTVTDTTTYNTGCVTVWEWDWGDGTVTYGQTQLPHTYYNAGPANRTYTVSLIVTSGTFTSTFGGYSITVKP